MTFSKIFDIIQEKMSIFVEVGKLDRRFGTK